MNPYRSAPSLGLLLSGLLQLALLLAATAPALLVAGRCQAAESANAVLRLWPGTAPGEQGAIEAEKADAERVTNVSEPTLTVFPAPKEKASRVGLIVAPGGAYRFLSWSLEGTEIARWYNGIGVTVFVLKYRVPTRSFDPGNRLALMDAQRAMSLVRARAKEWELDPGKIGFLGFSAGGHLGANLENNWESRAYDSVDDTDKTSCRPDFTILIYPGGMLDPKDPAHLAPEMRLTKQTPPTFIALAADDTGSAENSLRYFQALRAAGIPGELHVYAAGGHGFGIRPRAGVSATWTDRSADWLRTMKILAAGG